MKHENVITVFVLLILFGMIYIFYESEGNVTNKEISKIYEDINVDTSVIDQKIAYFNNTYNVNIDINCDVTGLDNKYVITPVKEKVDILDAVSKLEDYFILYNKEFFNRFYEYGMEGLTITFADSITTKNKETTPEVIGLYLKKANKYYIVVSQNTDTPFKKIMAHETMHLMEDYLSIKNNDFKKWSNYNPKKFKYANVYYVNETFQDTLNNFDPNQVYFIDNYARSSKKEDLARTFEALCNEDDFKDYVHIQAKLDYIKSVIITYFPELSYVSLFN